MSENAGLNRAQEIVRASTPPLSAYQDFQACLKLLRDSLAGGVGAAALRARRTGEGARRHMSRGHMSLDEPHTFFAWSGFGGNAGSDLYLRFALTLSNESGARTFHAQAYIPTQPAQAIEDTRISQAHEDPGRQEGNFPPARQGAQTGLGETRFPRIVLWRG